MRKVFFIITLLLSTTTFIFAQKSSTEVKLVTKLNQFFNNYSQKGTSLDGQPRMISYKLDDEKRTLEITANDYFAAQAFTPEVTAYVYKQIRKRIPQPYNSYKITVYANNLTIDELIPNRLSENLDKGRMWGDINYTGTPWVFNQSHPVRVTHGLQNRHIAVWASHGRYYGGEKKGWAWQRPNLFCTNEDLFTQTIVVPFLIPMLENAGAIVFTPRERDWQKDEIIVDNDYCSNSSKYNESYHSSPWKNCSNKGFAMHPGVYVDNENPFTAGTARMATATSRKSGNSYISYIPNIKSDGKYAVYVSYQTLANSIPDAHYIVWHKGEKTEFTVNQQMGGGTWVYLGTFDFDGGCDRFNCVTLSNSSDSRGVVTADAVRFGGGMGNISRGGNVSGLPTCLEGERYYAQWAGMDYSVYSSKNGADDYGDDINARSYMVNYLGGGSVYMPSLDGDKVPIELSVAVHSDAGYSRSGNGLIGSLAICTTDYNDGKLNAGISRLASRDLADALLSGAVRDITYKYGKWNRRELFDRNYSETRNPEVPSAILETMSHQNFPDMEYGQDPNFRFTLARSIYKTILRYVCDQHGMPYIVTPLAPNNFSIEFVQKDEVKLRWLPVLDPQAPTSKATGYIVYTSSGHGGFDNGTYVRTSTSLNMHIEPGVIYNFRVTAVNRGGESFPSETLSALYQSGSNKTIMIVNGFHRLAAPAIIDNDNEQGFDINSDPGVSYGPTAGLSGVQPCFNKSAMGIEGSNGLGACGDELAGTFVAGNDFDYVKTHGEAIKASGRYSFVSCSDEAIETGRINIQKYPVVDILFGLEKNDGHSVKYYKTFSPVIQNRLTQYTRQGGSLLISGAYVGSDMTQTSEQVFLSNILKCRFAGSNNDRNNPKIDGMGTSFDIFRTINEDHYAATSTDILQPVAPAYCALRYADGTSACVAYGGRDYRCMTLGFPFECIKDANTRNAMMKGILNYLIK